MTRLRAVCWISLITVVCLAFFGPAAAAEEPAYDPEALDDLRRQIDRTSFREIEAEARRILAAVESEDGADSLPAAHVISIIVEALSFGPQPGAPELLALAERAVAITEAKGGPQHLATARAVYDHGLLLYLSGDYAAARPLLERALSIQEAVLGPDDGELTQTLNNLGGLLYGTGELREAQTLFERARDIRARIDGPDAERVAPLTMNIAVMQMAQGEFEAAIAGYERALAIYEKQHGAEHPSVARVLNNLAIAYEQMGDYGQAKTLYERSLRMREKTLDPDDLEIGSTHANLAILNYKMGDTLEALEHVKPALARYEKNLGADHPETLRIVNTYGTILDALGESEQAIEVMEENLAAREKALGAGHYDVAESRSALAIMYLDRGEAGKALPLLEQSLATREQTLGADHPVVAEALSDLGRAKNELGEVGEARELLDRALAIREARLGPDHPATAASLVELAELDWQEEKGTSALARARRAAGILQANARETLAVLPERQALLHVANQVHAEEILFSGLLSSAGKNAVPWIDACWEWSLGWRGLVLDELAERHRTVLADESQEARLAWDQLAKRRRELAALWVSGVEGIDPETFRSDLDEARRGKENAEVELARVSASFHRQQRDRQVSPADLAAMLPEGSALVEWVRVRAGSGASDEREPHDIALVIGSGGKRGFVDLGPSKRVDDAVYAWRDALERSARRLERGEAESGAGGRASADANRPLRTTGETLRRLVWDPLPASVRGADRLFFVPDGSLHQVDLAALPAADGGYLIESGPAVQLLSTGRDLVLIARGGEESGAPGRGLLALGDPDFDADGVARRIDRDEPVRIAYRGATPGCLALAGKVWPPLPESGREVREITGLFEKDGPAAGLTGAAASEERFKQDAPGHRILHLATHGFFLAGDCADESGEDGHEPAIAASPLLKSGLVLAGANRIAGGGGGANGMEDGLLTAEELAAIDLRGVDLAVLSACDTGQGEVAVGEGVFGLRRALEIAGVRSVVMSLWPVPDRQARRWMARFYGDRLSGSSITEASREAALANLKELRARELPDHPYYWAGIVAAGDWQ